MAPGALAQVLGDLPNVHNDNLLVGFDTSDDASVFRVGENLGLVQSIDFFPPMVDDPFLFGQIAAANSLSDIYAMGGRPSHAMNLLCIPSCLGVEVAGQILAGGAENMTKSCYYLRNARHGIGTRDMVFKDNIMEGSAGKGSTASSRAAEKAEL